MRSCGYIFSSIFILFIFSINSLYTQQSVLHLTDDIDRYNLGSSLEYFSDSTKSLSYRDVQLLESDDWSYFDSQHASLPGSPGHHWIRCKLYNNNPNETTYYLSIDYAHIAEYQLYHFVNDQMTLTDMQGDNFRFDNREMASPYFVHKIVIPYNSPMDLLIRIDQEGQDIPLPIILRTDSELLRSNTGRYIVHGISIGIIMLLGISIYFIYRTTGVFFLFLESLVLLLSILYVFAEEGYGFMFIWGNLYPSFNGLSRPLTIGLVTIVNVFVSLYFLDFKKQNPRLFKYSIVGTGFYGLSMILFHPVFLLPFKTEDSITTFIVVFLIMTAIATLYNCFIALYAYIRYGNKDAIVLILVYIVIALIIITRSLSYLFQIQINFISQHGGILALTMHCLIIGGYMLKKALNVFNEKQLTILQLSEDKRLAAEAMLQNLNQERERISMDIHDSLGSLLSGISLNMASLRERIPNVSQDTTYLNSMEYITQLDEEMRLISHNLLPKTLKAFGLIHELMKITETITASHDIQFKLEFQGFEKRLKDQLELELYKMTQEIMDNIIKHANASHVLVQINQYSDEVHLIIEDDGRGYDPELTRPGGNGLENLRNRTKLLNGEIDIYSKIREGTSISINIPLG